MMGVPVLVPAVIRARVTAAGAVGAGGMVTVAAVAAEATVGLTLVQSAGGGHLVAGRISGRGVRVVHRLTILVISEQPIRRLRVRV